jgi:hypothetical protein
MAKKETQVTPGLELAATEAITTWNHNAFLDYIIRWMTQDDSAVKPLFEAHFPGHQYIVSQRTANGVAFTDNMWAAYGSSFRPFRIAGLTLRGSPGSQAIYLNWTVVDLTLPVTSTWRIDYQSQTGTAYLPITDILSPTRAYTLTDLTNYAWYTITLNAMLDSTPMLTDTVRVMPTDRLVYLPLVLK